MKYGLLAVFIAAAFEADIVPILTGVLAHLGYVDVVPAILCATVGAWTGDFLWYVAGRYYSNQLRASAIYTKAGPIAERLMARFGDWQIPASHVIYGTRIATMVLSGIRSLPVPKFALFDGLGCLWLTTFLFGAGFMFSANADQIITSVKRVELFLLVAVLFSALFFYLMRKVRESAARS